MLPLSWIGFPGSAGFVFLFFVAMILAGIAGVSFLVFDLFFLLAIKYKNYFLLFPLFLAFILFSEILKTLLLWLLFFDLGMSLSLHWTLLSVGYFISFPPFLHWAAMFHVYGLSICLGYILYLGYLLILRERKPFLVLFFMFIVVTSFFSFASDKQKTIGISLQKVVVKPEGVSISPGLRYLPDVLYIDGGHEIANQGQNKFNVSKFFLNGSHVKVVRKEFLMPFGEYMPLLFKPLAVRYLNKENKSNYEYWYFKRFNYIEGENSNRTYELNQNFKIATLLCSEIFSFDVLFKLKQEKPNLIYLQGSYLNFNQSKYFNFFLTRWIVTAEEFIGTEIIIVKAE